MYFDESVLICDEVDSMLYKVLEDNGLKVTYEPTITSQRILETISNFNIIIVRSRTIITKDVIGKAKKCIIIARVGVGLDNIDLDAANSKNIKVINAAEGARNSVAELVLGFMLSLARRTFQGDRGIHEGKWLKTNFMGTELRGKFLGIIGLGNIGKQLARLAKGLEMNILGHDIHPINKEFSKEVGLQKVDLDTLLSFSDYVSLHVPLADSTYHLIEAQKLSLMKRTAKLINTSRGGIIDEDALFDALNKGVIEGAALDVFEKEPVGHKLASLDNVILTPHIGAQTIEAQYLAGKVIGEKILQILKSK